MKGWFDLRREMPRMGWAIVARKIYPTIMIRYIFNFEIGFFLKVVNMFDLIEEVLFAVGKFANHNNH